MLKTLVTLAPVVLGAFLIGAPAWASAPYIPDSDSTVLLKLPRGSRVQNSMVAPRPEVASLLAQRYLEQAQQAGDPRLLGYAERLLQPFAGQANEPAINQWQRATLLQARHRFADSLAVLRAIPADAVIDAQAALSRAAVLRATGQLAAAQAACPPGDTLPSQICLTALRGMQQPATTAYSALAALVAANPLAAPVMLSWLHSELAEAAERNRQPALAAQHHRNATSLQPQFASPLLAYLDFLLAQGQVADAAQLSHPPQFEGHEGLMLRQALLCLAQHGACNELAEQLSARYAATRARGDIPHAREEARLLLAQGQPALALVAAQQNWATQREPADALILLQAAKAAGQPAAAQPVRTWQKASGYQDARL